MTTPISSPRGTSYEPQAEFPEDEQKDSGTDWYDTMRTAASKDSIPSVLVAIENCPPNHKEEYIEAAIRGAIETQRKPLLERLFKIQDMTYDQQHLTFRHTFEGGTPELLKWHFTQGLHLEDDHISRFIKRFFEGDALSYSNVNWSEGFEFLLSRLPRESASETVLDAMSSLAPDITTEEPEMRWLEQKASEYALHRS